MFFGGLPELLHFTRRCQRQCVYAALVLTEFDLFGTPVRPDPLTLGKGDRLHGCVTLSYAQNTFSFEFSALVSAALQQSIPLHARGLDANWHVVGSVRGSSTRRCRGL